MKRFDLPLCAAVAALAAFGAAVQTRIAGTLPDAAGLAPLGVGVAAAFAAAFAFGGGRAERLLSGRGKWCAWGAAMALMAALLVFGRRYRGGLYLPGLINPSEAVKLCAVLFAAGAWTQVTDRDDAQPSRRLPLFAGAVCALGAAVAAAGDFGLLAQLALTGAAMAWAASWAWGTAAGAVIGGGAGFVAWATHGAGGGLGHLATRFAIWRDPFADVMGDGWQTLQGLAAVAAGGVTGAGFGMGDVQTVPIVASDFVYAAVAEELGLVGCAAVLAAWGFVFWRGLAAARRRAAEGLRAEALLAAGLTASLAVQTILNVGGVLNVLPMTGITLPLVSHGGSSQATVLAMCGILAALSRRR